MTAKEKAIELMLEYHKLIEMNTVSFAKQCALITVEELIKENYPRDIERCIYLHDVKREIELL